MNAQIAKEIAAGMKNIGGSPKAPTGQAKDMKIKVFNKVLLDTIEYESLEDMKRKNFCGAYFALQVGWALDEKGQFEDEFYTITGEV